MSVKNFVVSGRRVGEVLGRIGPSTETVAGQFDDMNSPADLAPFVGPENVPGATPGLGSPPAAITYSGGECGPPAPRVSPSDVEKAAMLLSLNASVAALEEADVHPGVMATVENRIASLLQSYLADKAGGRPGVAGEEVVFDEHDFLGWAGSFFTWWRGIVPHGWVRPPATPRAVKNMMRMAVIGDWGTGMYGAPACAGSIQADGDYQVILHLGDIYYSGTLHEVEDRFLRFWPTIDGAVSLACNGNHEMYSGGYGYFGKILRRFGQSSSCFALQNDHWLMVGLDTAYEDHDLAHEQNIWLDRLVQAADGRGLVLFTHHQPYSYLEAEGGKLIEKLRTFLSGKRISAWYWGHEHRCVLYDRHPHWDVYGRCIGHGGYPYFREPSLPFARSENHAGAAGAFWRAMPGKGSNPPHIVPPSLLLDGPNPYVAGYEDDYGPNGYLTLEFDGPNLYETIHLPDGTIVYCREQLV